jgi:membrane-bound lytic murein transglycosylase B
VRLVALAFVLALAAPQDTPVAPAPPVESTSFDTWLTDFIDEARTRGYSDEIIQQTVHGLEPLHRAIESDRSQPELTIGFERYFQSRVTRTVVRRGRELARAHRTTLRRIEQEFGVPRRVVLAIWGMESRYGRNPGRTPVFQALATLAWEPRRSRFFRAELFDAIEMVARGYIESDAMKGSWAGAMGQPQFMPSSYLAHAVDFDGDSRRDIWASTPDTLASIGSYLKGKGWTPDFTWGREVKLNAAARKRVDDVPMREGTCGAMRDMTEARPLREWQKMGVRTVDGKALPRKGPDAALVQVQKRAFLVYPNYDAILRYNCAHHYALSVAMLSERLK